MYMQVGLCPCTTGASPEPVTINGSQAILGVPKATLIVKAVGGDVVIFRYSLRVGEHGLVYGGPGAPPLQQLTQYSVQHQNNNNHLPKYDTKPPKPTN